MASLSVDGDTFTPKRVIHCAISVSPSPLMSVPAPFDAVVGSPLSVLGAASPLNTFSSSRRQAGVRCGALRIAPLDVARDLGRELRVEVVLCVVFGFGREFVY